MEMSIPRPEYPRMNFVREDWRNLNGTWTFEFDFGNSGLERNLSKSTGFSKEILVPFCPESRLSGVEYTDFIPAMFYHRKLTIPAEWSGNRILLNFGAVDYECEGFLDGESVGKHAGGSSSFSFDLTAFAKPGTEQDFVLYVQDDTRSGVQALGKQSVPYQSRGCSYTRTTGIWQTVWMESVAMAGMKSCKITPDLDNGAFAFQPEYYQMATGNTVEITVLSSGKPVASGVFAAQTGIPLVLKLSEIRAWCPEDPFLYDVTYIVRDASGAVIDRIAAYAGLRKVHIEGDRFYLNNKEIFQRQVLDQGFYPEGIWTAPADADLKKDIELSMAAGFNGARLHQKVFEERFHYWADKLGYLTWGEYPSWGLRCFGRGITSGKENVFCESAYNFMSEWSEIVARDYNHPSIVAWTPVNETQEPENWETYRLLMRRIYDQTHLLDPTRPINETSGYRHVKTDLWTVHLYRKNAEELKEALHPEGKAVFAHPGEIGYCGQPYMVDEFGGFKYLAGHAAFAENTWGYYGMDIKSAEELCEKIAEQVEVLLADPTVTGYCYTQLTDVEQEQNGVYNYDRSLKVPEGKLKEIFGKDPAWLKK